MTRLSVTAMVSIAAQLVCGVVIAAESVQPYIDSLKSAGPENFAKPAEESYTEKLRRELPARPAPSANSNEEAGEYINSLKKSDPSTYEPDRSGSYTERQKEVLGGTSSPQGAIAAVKEGRSELKMIRKGEIRGASGIRFGAAGSRVASPVVTDAAFDNFEAIYGSGYGLDISLFSEFQLFHHERAGSLGLWLSLGAGYNSGFGQFAIDLPKPNGTDRFGSASQTKFQFFTIPLTAAASYRLNLLHYIRPFILGGPTLIGYIESRNDSKKGFRGNSRGLYGSVGANILLDWLSTTSSWDMYSNYGIHHTYLTLEYSMLSTFSGDVDFDVKGLGAGLTFEF